VKGFLIDENLPPFSPIEAALPMVHARTLGESLTDSQLWDYACENELAVVTKDADFSQRIMVATPPPWVVHLKFGNMRLGDYQSFLERTWGTIESLLPAHKLVRVYRNMIETIRD